MFDAIKALDSFMQSRTNSTLPDRLQSAAQSTGYAAPGNAHPDSSGLGSFGAGSLGAIAGAVLGKGGPGILGGSVMAIVGNLALKAVQAQLAGGNKAAPSPIPASAPGRIEHTPDAQRKATLMIRAMIQAAKADGTIDATETQRIMEKVGHDPDAAAFMRSEISKPIDLSGLCREVSSPQEAVEVYAASLLAIDVDTQAERDYLADLAANLRIAPETVSQVNGALGYR